MGLTYELDLSTAPTREAAEAGDRPPVDWYTADVTDHYEDHNDECGYILEFVIKRGARSGDAFTGKKLLYRFRSPGHAEYAGDAKKQRTAQNRIQMLASRLGLFGDDALGKANVAVDFDQTIGKAAVVQVAERKGDTATFTEISYSGVFPPDHPKIPKEVRAALSLPPAREDKGAAAASKTAPSSNGTTHAAVPPAAVKDDFSDL